MPLLRRKPFIPEEPPTDLDPDEEILFCDLTGEVFRNYDAFYERVILCNSLLWTCERTGRSGLTYKEAKDSEQNVARLLDAFPRPVASAVLTIVHHTRRGKLADLCDEIYEYLKCRYVEDESIEYRRNDQWRKGTVVSSPLVLSTSPSSDSLFSSGKQKIASPKCVEKNSQTDSLPPSPLPCSPIDNKREWPDAKQLEYKVQEKDKDESVTVKGKNIRRQKGIFVKDTIRLFIRKNCYRSTASSDDGFWKVVSKFIEEYQLGPSSVHGPLARNTPAKYKNQRKRTSEPSEADKDKETPKKKKKMEKGKSETKTKGAKKRKSKEKEQKKGKKKKKDKLSSKVKKVSRNGSKTEPKPPKLENLTEEERKQVLEEIKLKKKQEREEERKRKFLEKEEDKKRKKIEREKERETANKVKELELHFLKEWSKHRDDLKLEDLKPLPILKAVDSKLPTEHFGSILMVTEFLLAFGQLYQIEESIPYEVSSEIVEEALFEHDAEGKYYDILKFLLQSFLRVSQEENDEEEEEQSSDGNDTPQEMKDSEEKRSESYLSAPSAGATVAAAWPMLHQGQVLSQLTMDPFTLSEILRLHILSSGVKIGGALTLWQRRGGFQFSDDPCVHFRHKESVLMKALSSVCIYDLDPTWKLRILCVLCDQLLTLVTTRDYIEDAFDKIKELKKQLRELQYAEHRRRKTEATERYKRRLNERAQVKEEILRRKKEKAEKINEGGKDKSASEAADSKGKVKSSPVSIKVTGDSTPSMNEKMDEDEPMLTLVKLTDITEEEEAREKEKRDVFSRKESELKKELVKYAAINGQSPLGRDRALRCYWAPAGSNRLLVEGGNHDVNLLLSSRDEDYISDGDGDNENEEETRKDNKDDDNSQAGTAGESCKTEVEKPIVPQITLQEVNEARGNKEALLPLLLERYKCDHTLSEGEILRHSKILERIRDDVCHGVNPNEYEYKAEKEELWQTFDTAEKIETLLKNLNERGLRECNLITNLKVNLDRVVDGVERSIAEAACRDASLPKVKPTKGGDSIDKTLFKSMNDFLEANLRDQILDFEDRLWNGSLGVIKVEDRVAWRRRIEDGLAKLIVRDPGSSTECDMSTENVQGENSTVTNGVSPMHTLGKERGMREDDVTSSEDQKPFKSLALKIKDEFAEDKCEGCTTPTTVGTPTVNPVIKELGQALLQVEKGIERKFLKPPLGEDEERKKERIKEMFDAAKTEFEEMNLKMKQEKKRKRQSNGLDKDVCDLTNGDVKGESVEKTGDDDNASVSSSASEELKKERTCLERWEASLKSACNFSQLFIHLNTLDQSVMWDKSVLNARCKKCRRKGDAEQMLLCDGCDRGFHIYCLVPPMKQIPQGDWFCQDCRPKEPRRSARRRKPSKIVCDSDFEDGEDGESGETEDWDREEGSEESDSSSDNTEEDGDDDSDDEDDDETENSSAEDSEEQEEEEEAMEQDDETLIHNDYCSICAVGGTLLCCDTCHRAYHTLCTYPPMKKVPKGNWSCQVCTQAESELPKSRRVVTIEKQREKGAVDNEMGSRTRSSARSKSVPQRSTRVRTPAEDKVRTSLTGKRKRAQSASPGIVRPRKVTRRSKADTPVSGKRSKVAPKSPAKVAKGVRRSSNFSFGRYERRQCSKLLEELMSQDDADPFLAPVDTKLVPDYKLYIDHPMDFGTIKRNINAAHYNTLDEFLDDVRLVFKNCETYNAPRSAIARAGTRLSLHFEQRLLDMELCSG